MRAAQPDACASSCRWPTRPKPVTSVTACGPTARSAAAASRLSVVIEATAAASVSGGAASCRRALATTPVPSPLVSTSTSPGRPPAFVQIASGCTVPVTARPYFGSGSVIVWPPTTAMPASRATSAPPRMMAPAMAWSRSPGMPAMASANSGCGAHRVDVGDRVGRGDAAEVVGVVDDGREEVDRLHERQVVAEPHAGGVVERRGADQHARVVDRRQAAQHLGEVGGGQLAGAAAAGRHAGQPHGRGRAHAGLFRVIRRTPVPGQTQAAATR